jgi:CBS domain containing-hemolysin-like protein
MRRVDSTTLRLVAIAALVLINGFFVAAEFALVSVRPQRLTESSSPRARLVRRQVAHLDEYLAACQLGITIASLALGALGEPTIASMLEPLIDSSGLRHGLAAALSTVLALLIMTALHIVIGEQAPKSFAIGSAGRTAMACAVPLELFHRALRPLVLALNAAANAVVGLFGGVPASGHASNATLEELRLLIGAATDSGDVDKTDARILRGAFTLDERRASDVMTPRRRLVMARSGETIEQALRRALDEGRARLPLVDPTDESLLGVVYQRELTAAMLDGRGGDDVITLGHEMPIAPETVALDRLLARLQRERASICAILDEYGTLAGVVTVEDVVEEIVGEIEDETDRPAGIRRLVSGAVVANGDTPLVDLEEDGIFVDDDVHSESIGGLVVERLERLAEPGDEIEVSGRRVRVLSVDGNRVGRVLIGPPLPRARHEDDGDEH